MSFQRWPWLERGALPLSVLLMRLFWLWPWLLLIGRWTLPPEMRPLLPLWLVAALMLGGALAARALPVDPERTQRARTVAALMGLTAMLLTLWWRVARADAALWDVRWIADQAYTLTHWNGVLPLSIGILGLSAYLWLRGMQDGGAANHDDIWRAFAVGFMALVLLLIVGRVDPSGPLPNVERWIILFFAVGMAGLALAGLRMARGTRNPTAPLPTSRYWLGSLLAIVGVLLVVGLLLAFLITPDGVARVMGWVGVVTGWIVTLLGYIFYALVYVMFLVLTPLIYWLEEHVGEWLQFNVERLAEMQRGVMEAAEQPAPVNVPTVVDEGTRWVLLAFAALFVALAFAGALRMLRKRNAEADEEVRETILTQSLLRDQASALLKRWRDRLRRGPSTADSPYLALHGDLDARRRVRAAYQSFLAALSAHGVERRRRQTPTRYAESVRATMPAQSAAIDALTNAYVAARYDSAEPAESVANAAESAWSDIRNNLEQRDQ